MFYACPTSPTLFSSTGTIMKEIPRHKCDPKASSVFHGTVTLHALMTHAFSQQNSSYHIPSITPLLLHLT